jgi:hypothetical protein
MSGRYFPIKSVILKGKLNENIVYRLCPITEFSEGIWCLSVRSLSYTINALPNQIKNLFSISCNQIKGQKFSSSNEIETYNQPLSMFLIKNDPNEVTKNVIYFDTQWFHINALSNELKFVLTNEENNAFAYQSDICVQIIFQRYL